MHLASSSAPPHAPVRLKRNRRAFSNRREKDKDVSRDRSTLSEILRIAPLERTDETRLNSPRPTRRNFFFRTSSIHFCQRELTLTLV